MRDLIKDRAWHSERYRERRSATRDGIERCHTLQEIADEMGLTRERVRQIEVEALGKLRQALDDDGRGLHDLLEQGAYDIAIARAKRTQ